jgi:hypothetical protein
MRNIAGYSRVLISLPKPWASYPIIAGVPSMKDVGRRIDCSLSVLLKSGRKMHKMTLHAKIGILL